MWVGDADELAQVRWVLTRAELDELLPGMYQARARLPSACSRVLRCCFEGRALAAPDPGEFPERCPLPADPPEGMTGHRSWTLCGQPGNDRSVYAAQEG